MAAASNRARLSIGPHGRSQSRIVGKDPIMLVFFSNRLGCVGSLIVSAVATLLLIAILKVLSM